MTSCGTLTKQDPAAPKQDPANGPMIGRHTPKMPNCKAPWNKAKELVWAQPLVSVLIPKSANVRPSRVCANVLIASIGYNTACATLRLAPPAKTFWRVSREEKEGRSNRLCAELAETDFSVCHHNNANKRNHKSAQFLIVLKEIILWADNGGFFRPSALWRTPSIYDKGDAHLLKARIFFVDPVSCPFVIESFPPQFSNGLSIAVTFISFFVLWN